MSNSLLLQLGVGGIFAILVLKEVFSFLLPFLRHRNGRSSDVTMELAIELLKSAIEILKEIRTEQRTNIELVRSRFHEINNHFQRVVLMLDNINRE